MTSFKHYSLKDISQLVGVSVRTLWAKVKTGELKAVKIGREYKVSEANLKKFLKMDGEDHE